MALRRILGEHPTPYAFGCHTNAEDGRTTCDIPHRALTQEDDRRAATIAQLRSALIDHHISADMIAQDQRKLMNLRAQGYPVTDADIHRFPRSDKTRKGNIAEIFLAEYVCSSFSAGLPVYRLRYNPNVEQSMKGDDVLAFDFSLRRPRIIVGEAKFRKTPSKKAVQDIVRALVRSHQAGLPVSLQFVADRLYEAGNIEFANRVSDCSLQMASGKLDLNYVGFLLSNANSKSKVNQHTDGILHNIVMISLGMENPSQLVHDCFDGIEQEAYDDSE